MNKAERLLRENIPYDAMGDYTSLLSLVREEIRQRSDKETQTEEDEPKEENNNR